MLLTLRCSLIAGTDRGGEDVVLYADLGLPVEPDVATDAALDAALAGLRASVESQLDLFVSNVLEEDDELSEPGDDHLCTPDENVVYVNRERVFTGKSDHYEQSVDLTREDFVSRLVKAASDPYGWKLTRRYGQAGLSWRLSVEVAREGNAE